MPESLVLVVVVVVVVEVVVVVVVIVLEEVSTFPALSSTSTFA